MHIQNNIELSKHTYFRLGGPADFFVEASTREELIEAVQYGITNNLSYIVLGSGSNVLISDSGFRGLVIKNKTSEVRLRGFTGSITKWQALPAGRQVNLKEVVVQADSGVIVNYLIRYTLDQGLGGLEDMLGLPGTVGGAVYNNSHHLDKLWGDHILEVEVIDRSGKIKKYTQQECHFGYDASIFHKTKEIILSASFQLTRGDKEELWKIANAAVKRRAKTQPLGAPSSGCIFKNIPIADAMRLGTPNGTRSVGYLIDKAGLKALRVGGAYVSEIHANFIINDGTATTQDVLDLIAQIKTQVKTKFGVDITEEVFVI